jgi:hypothetical protein
VRLLNVVARLNAEKLRLQPIHDVNDVRHLPKWLWVVIVIISIPVGGIVYLLAGRQPKVIDD